MTSREYILDLVEYISNQIAITSHLQELLNDKYSEEDSEWIHDLQELINNSINDRRKAMKKMLELFDWDKQYRCLVKHAIASWGYATEVMYADKDADYVILQHNSYEQMMKILSKFLKAPAMVTCWRCLQDILLEK